MYFNPFMFAFFRNGGNNEQMSKYTVSVSFIGLSNMIFCDFLMYNIFITARKKGSRPKCYVFFGNFDILFVVCCLLSVKAPKYEHLLYFLITIIGFHSVA